MAAIATLLWRIAVTIRQWVGVRNIPCTHWPALKCLSIADAAFVRFSQFTAPDRAQV